MMHLVALLMFNLLGRWASFFCLSVEVVKDFNLLLRIPRGVPVWCRWKGDVYLVQKYVTSSDCTLT